jgi:hypothetical protein
MPNVSVGNRDRPGHAPLAASLAASLAAALAAALAAGIVTGAPARAQQPSAQETVAYGRPLSADASIKVWNGSGSVRVEGWDADSLAVTGTVDGAGGGRFFAMAGDDVAKVGVEGDQDEVGGRLVVRVPRGATVWIRTGSAEVVARELAGAVDIHTVAGRVDARGRPATFYAESMAGDLELHLKAGVARASTGTGDITFTGSVQDLALRTVSGTLDVTAPELLRGQFTTVDGDIGFRGAIRPAGALAFETHSGDVSVRLPASLSADLRLSTFEGGIEVGYAGAGAPRSEGGRRSLLFEAGAGEAEVTVRSWSGSIRVAPR